MKGLKTMTALAMAGVMTLGVLAGCGGSGSDSAQTEAQSSAGAQSSNETQEAAGSESNAADDSSADGQSGTNGQNETEGSAQNASGESGEAQAGGFVIEYPSYLKETEGENLVMDEKPENIICLSNSALQILVRSDIQPIAVTSPASSVEYPDWVSELPVIETGMSELDTESVIAMEPDLVIMGQHLQEDYGTLLDSAGIPVYYTSEGPSITYEEVKEEARVISTAFGGEELANEIASEFEAVEQRAAEYCNTHDTKQMMILFSMPPTYQQTSKGYLGSMLSMLPFENLCDTLIDPESRTAPLDQEKLVEINPEVIFAISPTMATAEDLKAGYAEQFEQNPEIWDSLQAVTNDNIIYLSNEYVTSKGIQMINSMNALMDLLDEKFQ